MRKKVSLGRFIFAPKAEKMILIIFGGYIVLCLPLNNK